MKADCNLFRWFGARLQGAFSSVLSFAILYYTILHYTIPYYTILYYTILYYTILYYTILYYTILYYTILYYTILYYTILYYTILYYTILYYTILYYTILYYTILAREQGSHTRVFGSSTPLCVAEEKTPCHYYLSWLRRLSAVLLPMSSLGPKGPEEGRNKRIKAGGQR